MTDHAKAAAHYTGLVAQLDRPGIADERIDMLKYYAIHYPATFHKMILGEDVVGLIRRVETAEARCSEIAAAHVARGNRGAIDVDVKYEHAVALGFPTWRERAESAERAVQAVRNLCDYGEKRHPDPSGQPCDSHCVRQLIEDVRAALEEPQHG